MIFQNNYNKLHQHISTPNDEGQDVLVKCQEHNLVEADGYIYIPVSLWVRCGGTPAKTPDNVILVRAAKPKDANVVHLSKAKVGSSQIDYYQYSAYCGSLLSDEVSSSTIDEVTCPQCLMELAKINTKM